MTVTPPRPRAGRSRTVRLRGEKVSFILRRRTAVVYAGLMTAVFATATVSLIVGDYTVAPQHVPAALAGHGERLDVFFVQQLRAPRAMTAMVVGACLGVAGAVFQSLSRNPLGSPDIIGFTSGAATGAVAAILLFGATMAYVSVGAIVGGLATAAAVYLLAFKNGVQGYRLVLVGIGVSAMLASARDYLITRADLTQALTAQIWMIGSLNNRTWGHVAAVSICAAVLLPTIFAFGPRLRLMEMGDDVAQALGVRIQATQAVVLIAASALTGAAIAVAGPIGFVALAAPQLARKLVRANGTTLFGAAAMGALLLVASDLIAQHALASTQLPVGVVTAVLGGSYLVWLLYREWRGGRA